MAEDKIICPHCNQPFSLREHLTSEHIKNFANIDIDQQVNQKVSAEIEKINEANAQKEKKLKEASREEINKIKEERGNKIKKLEEEYERLEVRKEQDETNKKKYERELRKKYEEQHEKEIEEGEQKEKKLKEASREEINKIEEEKGKKLEEMQQKHDLERRREQVKFQELTAARGGDVELQGEAFEEIVKSIVRQHKPEYTVEDVKKGKKGADLIITTHIGAKILIEAKDASGWKNDWIEKLKEDIKTEGADHGIIVSKRVMPSEAKGQKYRLAGHMVSIVDFNNLLPVLELRVHIAEQAIQSQLKLEGGKDKKDQLYAFVHSKNFENAIDTMLDSIEKQKEQLRTEENRSQKSFEDRRVLVDHLYTNFYRTFTAQMQLYIESESSTSQILDVPEEQD